MNIDEEAYLAGYYYRQVFLSIITTMYPPDPDDLVTHWRRRTRFAQFAFGLPEIAYGRPLSDALGVWHPLEAP